MDFVFPFQRARLNFCSWFFFLVAMLLDSELTACLQASCVLKTE
jgi:hypothetical protein